MMSRIFRIFSLVLALVLMASLAVLAAPQISGLEVSDPDENGTYTITANINDGGTPSDGKQVTMFTYKSDSGNIIGIDQKPSDGQGDASFNLGTNENTPEGWYTAKVGGEGVGTAASTTFYHGTQGATISGIVGPIVAWYAENPDEDPIVTELNSYFGVVDIKLYDMNDEQNWEGFNVACKQASITVSTYSDDPVDLPFELTGVADGYYILEMSRKGVCSKLWTVVVEGDDVIDIGTQALIGADANSDQDISVRDVLDVLGIFASRKTDFGEDGTNYIPEADINGDGSISPSDVLGTLNSFVLFGDYHYLP